MNKTLLASILTLLGSACSTLNVESYKDQSPKLDFGTFFSGPMDAWGMVQDRSGRVTERFHVEMVGTWDGKQGTLEEDFTYADGRKQQRTWLMKQTGPDEFEGTAGDIVGPAKGKVSGNALRWNYIMKLDYQGSTYEIPFDDWMFLMTDEVMLNRSILTKFGFKVAEIFLVMKKKK